MFALLVSTHPSIRRLTLRLTGFVRGRPWLPLLVAMAFGIATGMAIGPTGGWLSPASRAADVAGSAAALSLSILPAQIVSVVLTNPLQASVVHNM